MWSDDVPKGQLSFDGMIVGRSGQLFEERQRIKKKEGKVNVKQ
jgi:hypothetical protein